MPRVTLGFVFGFIARASDQTNTLVFDHKLLLLLPLFKMEYYWGVALTHNLDTQMKQKNVVKMYIEISKL